MESVKKAMMANDDNLPALLDTVDLTSSDGMFELYIQCSEAGNETEAQKWLSKAAELGHCRALNVVCARAESLWQDHLFEPFLRWVNEELAPAHWLQVSRTQGAT